LPDTLNIVNFKNQLKHCLNLSIKYHHLIILNSNFNLTTIILLMKLWLNIYKVIQYRIVTVIHCYPKKLYLTHTW